MRVKVTYKIGIEREFLDREVAAVCRDFGIPSDESGAVGIEEIIRSSDVDSEVLEDIKQAVSEAVLIVIE